MTLTLPSGKSLISNPLANGGNRVSDILPSVPSGSTLAKFNPATGKWETNTFTSAWSQPGMTLAPGEGAVFDNKGDAFSVIADRLHAVAENIAGHPGGRLGRVAGLGQRRTAEQPAWLAGLPRGLS